MIDRFKCGLKSVLKLGALTINIHCNIVLSPETIILNQVNHCCFFFFTLSAKKCLRITIAAFKLDSSRDAGIR
jgi:hypothetical protein